MRSREADLWANIASKPPDDRLIYFFFSERLTMSKKLLTSCKVPWTSYRTWANDSKYAEGNIWQKRGDEWEAACYMIRAWIWRRAFCWKIAQGTIVYPSDYKGEGNCVEATQALTSWSIQICNSLLVRIMDVNSNFLMSLFIDRNTHMYVHIHRDCFLDDTTTPLWVQNTGTMEGWSSHEEVICLLSLLLMQVLFLWQNGCMHYKS